MREMGYCSFNTVYSACDVIRIVITVKQNVHGHQRDLKCYSEYSIQ